MSVIPIAWCNPSGFEEGWGTCLNEQTESKLCPDVSSEHSAQNEQDFVRLGSVQSALR